MITNVKLSTKPSILYIIYMKVCIQIMTFSLIRRKI